MIIISGFPNVYSHVKLQHVFKNFDEYVKDFLEPDAFIKAETKEEEEVKRENYLRRERRFGSMCRSVTLPGGLEMDKADADYSDGVLTLTFPKAEEVKPKSIKVSTK